MPFSQPEVVESFEQTDIGRQIENDHLAFECIHHSLFQDTSSFHNGSVSPMGEPHTPISIPTNNFQTPPINLERAVVPPEFDFPCMHRPYSSLVSHVESSSIILVVQTRAMKEPSSQTLTPSRFPPSYRSLSDMEISPHGVEYGSMHGGYNPSYHGEDPISHSQFIVHPTKDVEPQVHTVISNPVFTGQPSTSQPQYGALGVPWNKYQAHFKSNLLPQ